MVKTPNVHLQHLISELKKSGAVNKSGLWTRVAEDLNASTRRRRVVNLSRINRFTSPNEIVIVPGKVLGSGTLDHSVVIAAWEFSSSAKEQIMTAKGACLTILELLKKEPQGKNVRIIG